VTGCITLTAPLPADSTLSSIPDSDVISISFSDGVQTIAGVSALADLEFATSGGEITRWIVTLRVPSNDTIFTTNTDLVDAFLAPYTPLDIGYIYPIPNSGYGFIANDPGTWAVTPEPGTLWLTGTVAITIVMRKRARP
jgi:hypothetical protein